MAESREKLDMTEIEDMLRRGMPLLDAPESLSAEAVARHLEEKGERRRTPVYIFVRTAVAAALTLAIGLGVVYTIGQTHKKEAVDESMAQEAYSADGQYKAEDAYPADLDDLGRDSWEETEPEEAPDFSYNSGADTENTVELTLSPGGDAVVLTDIAYSDLLVVRPSAEETEESRGSAVCESEIRKGDSEMTELYVQAVSAGKTVLEIRDADGVLMTIEITVTD